MIRLLDEELKTRRKLAAWWNKVAARQSFEKAGIVSTPITPRVIIKKFCSIL